MSNVGRTRFTKLDAKSLRINGVEVTDPAAALTGVAALTENGGAIGGVNDSDIPTLTATVGADIAAFTAPPTAPEMALLRTFVNALKADNVALRAANRELADKVNDIIAAISA